MRAEVRAEVEAFLEGVIWTKSLDRFPTFLEAKEEAIKRWPPFPQPTQKEIEMGSRKVNPE